MDKTTIRRNDFQVNERPERQTIANILNFSKAYSYQKLDNGLELEMIQNWTKSSFGGFFSAYKFPWKHIGRVSS